MVVGGGDSAFEEALFLTRFGSSVTLIHRRDSFRASQIMVDRAQSNPKLTLLTNTVVTAIHGSASEAKPASPAITIGGLKLPAATAPQNVSSIDIRNTATGETGTLDTSAVFVAIRSIPRPTEFIADVVSTDDDGYITVAEAGTHTSAPGVFAAGDCVDRTYRQAISAAGMGCRAALDAQQYLTA